MSEPTEEEVRSEVRAWLKFNWSIDYGLIEWRHKLHAPGWGAPPLPPADVVPVLILAALAALADAVDAGD